MKHPFLSIKGFGDFQHYKNRRPPWIKFYASVLEDVTIMQLPEAAQCQLFKLWLVASQMGNPLPNNPRLLAGKVGAQGKNYIGSLIAAGFLIPCDAPPLAPPAQECEHDASNGASESLGDIGERKRTEREGELETDPPVLQAAATPVNIAVWSNQGISARWGEQTRPLTHTQAVSTAEDLAHVPAETVRDSIATQCRESRNANPPTHPNYFRPGILEAHARNQARAAAAAAGEVPPSVRRGRKLTPGEEMYSNIMGGDAT